MQKLFLSTYTNKIDKKGRVSMPSSYRSIINEGATITENNAIIIYPSIKNNCIEASTLKRFQQISDIISELDPFSEERDAFETIILGSAQQITIDSEGRVSLPGNMLEEVLISERIAFVGKGSIFEIWQPELFAKHQENAHDLARKSKHILKNIIKG